MSGEVTEIVPDLGDDDVMIEPCLIGREAGVQFTTAEASWLLTVDQAEEMIGGLRRAIDYSRSQAALIASHPEARAFGGRA